jgi:hypothetical protein
VNSIIGHVRIESGVVATLRQPKRDAVNPRDLQKWMNANRAVYESLLTHFGISKPLPDFLGLSQTEYIAQAKRHPDTCVAKDWCRRWNDGWAREGVPCQFYLSVEVQDGATFVAGEMVGHIVATAGTLCGIPGGYLFTPLATSLPTDPGRFLWCAKCVRMAQ